MNGEFFALLSIKCCGEQIVLALHGILELLCLVFGRCGTKSHQRKLTATDNLIQSNQMKPLSSIASKTVAHNPNQMTPLNHSLDHQKIYR
jgi:hypothetical protein